VKNDTIDALNLARLHRAGELAYIWTPDATCAFRNIRPPIPTTCAHLFRTIRPPVMRCREAVDFGYQA
jgi:hypothetical protein